MAGLLAHAALSCSEAFRRYPGIDFYHYWAVPQARSVEPRLGSPYLDTESYASVLARLAEGAGPQHRAAASFRRELDLTGTPVSYVLLGFLPGDYSTAFGAFQAAQVLALTAAVVLILLARRLPAELGLACAGLFLLAYFPVTADLGVGNVNSFQLLVLATAAAWSARTKAAAATVWPALAVTVLVKPTLLAPAVMLGFATAVGASRPTLATAAVRTGIAAALTFAAPMLAFGDAGVWPQWWTSVAGERLLYAPTTGNWSTSSLIASATRLPVSLVAAGLLVLVVSVLALDLRTPQARSNWASDPFRAASAGVVIVLAASPLAWSHYFVLGLLPALWLLGSGDRLASLAGGAGLILASGLVPSLGARWAQLDLSTAWLTALSWLPLWLGLARESARARAQSAAGAGSVD